jgi:hypothetical protein
MIPAHILKQIIKNKEHSKRCVDTAEKAAVIFNHPVMAAMGEAAPKSVKQDAATYLLLTLMFKSVVKSLASHQVKRPKVNMKILKNAIFVKNHHNHTRGF